MWKSLTGAGQQRRQPKERDFRDGNSDPDACRGLAAMRGGGRQRSQVEGARDGAVLQGDAEASGDDEASGREFRKMLAAYSPWRGLGEGHEAYRV